MWILSSDGNVLGGKRLWLRPGTSHLLGRTSNKLPSGQQTYVPHDSISRKHLTLHIADVRSEDGAHVHSRSLITATESSSRGTVINGKKYKGQLLTFDHTKTEHIIQLASSPEKLKVEWQPVVLAAVGLSKAEKKEGAPMARMKDKLQQADIKFLHEYLPHASTHVIGKSRNTPAALQALLQAKWLLSESFIGVLSEACSSRGDDASASPLEDDFDKFWPREMEHILPSGTERIKRPNAVLEPDPERSVLFKDHTFIFLSESQHEKLLPVIAAGGGKAVLCPASKGALTAADVIAFTKEVSGKEDSRGFLLSQDSGPGIVLVGRSVSDDSAADELAKEIEGALNQCMINQKAFLDVILSKDMSSFRCPARDERRGIEDDDMADVQTSSSNSAQCTTMQSGSAQPPSVQRARDIQTKKNEAPSKSSSSIPSTEQPPEEALPEQPATRRRRRIITTQSHAKFGEDYDPNQVIRIASDSPEPKPAPSSSNNAQVVHNGDVDDEPMHNVKDAQRSRKRSLPVESDEEVEETADQKHDRMFPHAAALKRQKLEESKKGFKTFSKPKSELDEKPSDLSSKESFAKKGRRKALEPEPAIKERLQARVKFDEEQRLDEEAKADMSIMTNEDLRRIADDNKDNMIVTFQVLALERPQQDVAETGADHPEWAGRQNFKKFRSNKVNNGTSGRTGGRDKRNDGGKAQRQVISLIPAPGKDRGIGDEYWLSRSMDHRRGRRSQSQSQQSRDSRNHSVIPAVRRQAAAAVGEADVNGEEDDAHAFRRRIQRSREEDMEYEAARRALDENVREPGSTAPRGSTQTLRGDSTQPRARGKRPAEESIVIEETQPQAKRARQTKTASNASKRPPGSRYGLAIGSEDEDDPTAFRRTRR